MELVCIDITSFDFQDTNIDDINLTIGKIYKHDGQEISSDDLILVHIINDIGNKRLYNRRRFITVDEWRNRQIDKILK